MGKIRIEQTHIKDFTEQLVKYMMKAREEVSFHESIEGLSASARETAIRKASVGFGISWFAYSLELSQGGQKIIVSDEFDESVSMMGWMNSLSPNRAKKK